jgi:SpoVG
LASPSPPAAQPRLRKWVPHRSGKLRGFCCVELASGLVLNGLRVMAGKSGLLVAMPAQKQLDAEGRRRLDASGKPLFDQIVEFRDRRTSDRFGAMVIDLVRAAHPGDLEEYAS